MKQRVLKAEHVRSERLSQIINSITRQARTFEMPVVTQWSEKTPIAKSVTSRGVVSLWPLSELPEYRESMWRMECAIKV